MSEARKRSSSRGSSRSRSEQRESKQVHLADCEHLIREEWVNLPGGFTKTGPPLLIFPDKAQFNYLHVTDPVYGGNFRVHYLDEGDPDASEVSCDFRIWRLGCVSLHSAAGIPGPLNRSRNERCTL